MRSITIKAGETTSEPSIIAHWTVSTIFAPAYDDSREVFILGTHDGSTYGKILVGGQPLSFLLDSSFTVHALDSSIFSGVTAIKLQLAGSATNVDLIFPVHYKDT